MVAMREVAMLENVSWIMDREAARGRVFLFAHIGHLQKHVHQSNEVKQADGIVPFGEYARSRFGADYLVVGTYFGSAEGFPEGLRPAAPDSTGRRSARIERRCFLHRGPSSTAAWHSAGRLVCAGSQDAQWQLR
jgi:hypothetical protein